MTILSTSSVRMLIDYVVKYSRPPDIKSSSNVSLPFAWITGPRKRNQLVFDLVDEYIICEGSYITIDIKLGSVAGPVIQANGRLTFEDDLRSGGLLYFTT